MELIYFAFVNKRGGRNDMRLFLGMSMGRGFSLLELMMAIAIIGSLAAIVIPTYQGIVRKANEASITPIRKTVSALARRA